MFFWMIKETCKNIIFRYQYRRLKKAALYQGDSHLKQAGTGFLIEEIQPYSMDGPSGNYSIYVTFPSTPPPPQGYPVLYLLDGNAYIASAAEALRFQSRFATQSEIEPMIIVAVGYPGEAPIHTGRRTFDFLPPHSSKAISQRFMQGALWHQPGGADSFLDFLSITLRDAIAKTHPIDCNQQFLCGHSLGGFFALYSLLHAPDRFQKIIALSPAIWWDDQRLLRDADRLIVAMPKTTKADVLILVGEDETPDRPVISEMMKANAQSMVEKLEALAPESIHTNYSILLGENHQSLAITALSSVFRFASSKGKTCGIAYPKKAKEE